MTKQQTGSKRKKRATLKEILAPFDTLRFGVLATSESGKPYASLIAFALTPDHRRLIFATPRNTSKYRNMGNEPAVSVLLDDRSQHIDDLQSARAVTLLGTATEVRTAPERAKFREVFVEKHSELTAFVDAPDTALIAVTIRRIVHVAHFQEVSHWP